MVINGRRLYDVKPIANMELGKRRDEKGVSYGLAEVGYDIRLKQEIVFHPPTYEQVGTDRFTMVSAPMVGIDMEPFKPGCFALASAIEYFAMPPKLVGIVHDKSTWARRGLSVYNTVIEPGWKGYLTLELTYSGSDVLHLPAGCGIAQVIFHELDQPMKYEGKYQDQDDRPVPSITAR